MFRPRAAFLAALLFVPLAAAGGEAEPGKSGELYDTILAQDTALFDAFNTCKIEQLSTYVADDLQFFHDKGGLDVGRAKFLENVQKNVCGKFTRALEPGTFEVWPIPGYGAIATGVHRFHHPDNSADGIGKFLILWKNVDGHWIMTEAFSYAHAEAPK
jgi:hypothetical protein